MKRYFLILAMLLLGSPLLAEGKEVLITEEAWVQLREIHAEYTKTVKDGVWKPDTPESETYKFLSETLGQHICSLQKEKNALQAEKDALQAENDALQAENDVYFCITIVFLIIFCVPVLVFVIYQFKRKNTPHQEQAKNECPRCGEPVDSSKSKCPKCGTVF